jgi:hypothetical protein
MVVDFITPKTHSALSLLAVLQLDPAGADALGLELLLFPRRGHVPDKEAQDPLRVALGHVVMSPDQRCYVLGPEGLGSLPILASSPARGVDLNTERPRETTAQLRTRHPFA